MYTNCNLVFSWVNKFCQQENTQSKLQDSSSHLKIIDSFQKEFKMMNTGYKKQ